MKVEKMLSVLMALFLFFSVSPNVAADEEIEILGEYNMSRDEIDFTVSDSCSGHVCFNQATACEDGGFAIYTNYTNLTDSSQKGRFERVYIDIYNAAGELQKEISFDYTYNLAIKLLEDSIEIYLNTTLISYNWQSDEFTAYRIPANSLQESGLYRTLHASKFKSGEWEYQCRQSFYGYSVLTRENGEETQTLLSYPGTGFQIGLTTIPTIPLILAMVCLVLFGSWIIKTKRKQGRKD